jgi:hypothetical protein
VVSEAGIALDPEDAAVIRDWPVPSGKKELMRF